METFSLHLNLSISFFIGYWPLVRGLKCKKRVTDLSSHLEKVFPKLTPLS